MIAYTVHSPAISRHHIHLSSKLTVPKLPAANGFLRMNLKNWRILISHNVSMYNIMFLREKGRLFYSVIHWVVVTTNKLSLKYLKSIPLDFLLFWTIKNVLQERHFLNIWALLMRAKVKFICTEQSSGKESSKYT